jgi:hypothetical protein
MARVFARETALKVGETGLRLVIGASAESGASTLESALNLSLIHSAQAGLLADMDLVSDALYGRAVDDPVHPAARVEMALAVGGT